MGFLWESINGRPGGEKRGPGDKSYIEKLKISSGDKRRAIRRRSLSADMLTSPVARRQCRDSREEYR
ncbi:hypothetical protein DMB90_23775 [Raoultella planticola]|uniref:Uncharacterized protein n=1 Tax=Raoultella planticola TaxID=575 RepID=A0A5P6AAP2_RAOPL|nr:hypothetical protein DMB90_23775 [Raoultella planticola]